MRQLRGHVGRIGLTSGLLLLGFTVPLRGAGVVDELHSGLGEAAGALVPPAEAPVLRECSTLEELIHYAEANSPSLKASYHRYLAALEEVSLVKALPDPKLTVAAAAVPIETRVGPQRGRLSISQMVPGWGKREIRSAVASSSAEVAARKYETQKYGLAFEIAVAYYDLFLLTRSIEITRNNRDILVYLEQAIRTAYETGKAAYADLIRIQVEIGRLENNLHSLTDRLGTTEERLNRLLHRESGSPLPTPRMPDGPLILLADEELRGRLVRRGPNLAELDAQIEREAQRLRLAEIDRRVDWTFSLSYFPTGSADNPNTPDSGRDPVMASIGLNLPIWKEKYRAAARQAQQRHQATIEQRLSVEDQLHDRLEQALYDFRNTDREIRLYRDTLLPKAEESFEASEGGFRTGNVSVLDLVDAQRVLLHFELSYERALTQRAQAVAELRMLLGAEVLAPETDEGTDCSPPTKRY